MIAVADPALLGRGLRLVASLDRAPLGARVLIRQGEGWQVVRRSRRGAILPLSRVLPLSGALFVLSRQ